MIKKVYLILAIIGVMALSLILGWLWGKSSQLFENQQHVSASVVIEKMEKVLKLVTVEATLSEIYNYKDFYSYDISPLRKKAMVRINAKVAAGYDFDKIKITVDSSAGKVIIANMPKAELLSVDHTLDYYDIEQGLFNSFTPEDYNHINANAKEYIKKIALESNILEKATEQKKEMIDLWKTVLAGMGYKLELLEASPLPEFSNGQ